MMTDKARLRFYQNEENDDTALAYYILQRR